MIFVNGMESDTVSALDRGLMYGDGVFRTFPLRQGRAVLWQRHYAKLAADCGALRILCPAANILERDMAVISARHPDCVVKIVITRGTGPRGYAIPHDAIPTRIVTANPIPAFEPAHDAPACRVHLCSTRLGVQPALAGLKHLNRLENVLARSEWNDPAIGEGLMRDPDDNIVCGTMSNLFVFEQGVLLTPPVTRCGVAGVQRALVLELAHARNVPTRVTEITLDRLLAAEESFLVNSVSGIRAIGTLGRRTWNAAPLTARVTKWLADAQDH